MAANAYAIDALTRHQILIQRYGNGTVKKLIPILKEMNRDLTARIKLESNVYNLHRLKAMQRDVRLIIVEAMRKLSNNLTDEMVEFGAYESGFTTRLIESMVTTSVAAVNVDILAASISNTPMRLVNDRVINTVTMQQAIDNFAGATSKSVANVIRSGIANSDTTELIATNVSRLVRTRTQAQTESLIRTVANHTGSIARQKVYEENDDVIIGERFIATLDSHTTLTCAGNDNQLFDIGVGAIPPLHFQCRSIRVPEVNPDYVVGDLRGDRPSVGASGAELQSTRSNFSGWLRKQPASFQDEYFKNQVDGIEKAKLFRSGGLSIDKFTNDSGVVYDLNQLKSLEPQAFERANL